MSSFFVVSKQYEELARDEIISISKSYDSTSKMTVLPRLVMVSSKVPWSTIAKRATFARHAGTIAGIFDDITKIDDIMPRPETFVCRTINLSSKSIGSSLERQAGAILAKKWGSKVSLSNPKVTVYLIITDSKNYLGYADSQVVPNHPKKIIKHPHEIDMKLARCMVN